MPRGKKTFKSGSLGSKFPELKAKHSKLAEEFSEELATGNLVVARVGKNYVEINGEKYIPVRFAQSSTSNSFRYDAMAWNGAIYSCIQAFDPQVLEDWGITEGRQFHDAQIRVEFSLEPFYDGQEPAQYYNTDGELEDLVNNEGNVVYRNTFIEYSEDESDSFVRFMNAVGDLNKTKVEATA